MSHRDLIKKFVICGIIHILKRHVFVMHVTSVNAGSVQVTHRAVDARTMHDFGPDLVNNPAI